MKALTLVQSELKAPKSQYNSFGKYNYRNCEDILEAVKPLLVKHEAYCYITDAIEVHGDRVYVVATAVFVDAEGNSTSVKAYARESETKKGMDDSQITGSASSYARKYALNGLFLIDDTKDADSGDNSKKEIPSAVKDSITRCATVDDLNAFYKNNSQKYSGQKEEFTRLLAARKEEILREEATAGI